MMDGFDALKTVAGLPADFEDRLDWGLLREGVEISWICNGGETAASAAFLRYAPGAMVPRHHHPQAEYVLTLRGSQEDARGKHPMGVFAINETGYSHEVHSPEGCLVLIIWTRPVQFE